MIDNQAKTASVVFYRVKREQLTAIRERARCFAETTGRRPRILMASVDANAGDLEMKAVAAALADAGFDVDILGVLQSPEAAARIAVENDVHLLGIVGISTGIPSLFEDLTAALTAAGGSGIRLAVWGRFSRKRSDPLAVAGAESAAVADLTGDPIRSAERLLDLLTTRS